MMTNESTRQSPNSLPSPDQIRIGVGQLFDGRYKILEILGEGGMGIAYKALDTKVDQPVALKVLLPTRMINAKDTARFEREAKTSSCLSHPGIAKVFDLKVLDNEQAYLVMEFLEGKTLAQEIAASGPLSVEESLDIFIQISDALAYAHANGILHRDIKPSNIMVLRDRTSLKTTLLDFGIAKRIVPGEEASQSLTGTGDFLGSPLYASPEQARGSKIDPRSDLYSLGCTLYEALTGGPPHLGQTPVATLLRKELDKPIAMSEASLGRTFSKQLEHVVSRLLQINPQDRYQSATELKDDLILLREGRLPIPAKVEGQALANTVPNRTTSRRGQSYALALLILSVLPIAIFYLLSHKPIKKPLPSAQISEFIPPLTENQQRELAISNIRGLLIKADNACKHENYNQAAQEYNLAYKEVVEENVSGQLRERAIRGLALVYPHLQKFTEARPFLEIVVELEKNENGPSSLKYADALNMLATCYLLEAQATTQTSWEKAAPLFQQAESIYQRTCGSNSISLADCLQFQGLSCLPTQKSHARFLLEKAITIYRNNNAQPLTKAHALAGLAHLDIIEKAPKRAESRWRERIEILANQPREHDSELSEAILSLTDHYTNKLKSTDPRQYKLALALILHYLPHFEASPDPTLAVQLARSGELYLQLGTVRGPVPSYLHQALLSYQKALKLLLNSKSSRSPTVASIYLRIGQLTCSEQNYEQAKTALLAGLALLEKIHATDVNTELVTRQELARVYLRHCDFVEARQMAEKGISLCEITPHCKNSFMHATYLLFLARSYEHEKNFAKALESYKKSRSIFAGLANARAKSVQINIRAIDKALAGIAKGTSK